MKWNLLLIGWLGIQIIGTAQVSAELSKLLDSYAAHQRLSGTVLVKKGDQVLFSDAYGYANYQNLIENELNTRFNIGSLSKQFTAAAILHLAMQDKIDLNAPINQYLNKYASKRWKKVSVHHLLTHTSGIPSLMQFGHGLDDVLPQENVVSLEELIGYFRDLKLRNKPGKKYSYNNSGYVLLAAIIEEVSGQSYGEFMQQKIFEKYGLENTSHGIHSMENLACPYYNYTSSQRKPAPNYHASWFIGAGSIYANITDLAHWNSIIHSSDFLTAELRKSYFNKHEATNNGKYYAYGWEIMEVEGRTVIHHDGTTFGYTCDLLYEPKTETLSIIFTNQTHESLQLMGKSEDFVRTTNLELLAIAKGKKADPLPAIQPNNTNIRTGIYRFSDGYELLVTKEKNTWKVSSTTFSPLSYSYESPLELNTDKRESAARAVEGLVNKKFSKFAKECNGEMKMVTRLGILRLGMNHIMKGMGDWERSVLYEEEKGVIYFRIYTEKGAVDFFLSFDEEGKIQGVFDTDRFYYGGTDLPTTLVGYPIENGLYLNGFIFGEADALLKFEETGKVIFQQRNRTFEGAWMSKD